MLYLKAFHIFAIIAWMSGIFYLPRVFVHYAEGRAAGATGWIVKPFHPDQLLQVVAKVVP